MEKHLALLEGPKASMLGNNFHNLIYSWAVVHRASKTQGLNKVEIYVSHQNPRGSPGWLGQSRESEPNFCLDTLLFLALTLTLRSKTLVSVFQAVDPVIGKRMKGQKSSTCVFAGSFQELLHP